MQINKQDWEALCTNLGALPSSDVHTVVHIYAANAGKARDDFNAVAQAVGLNSTCAGDHVAATAAGHRRSANKFFALRDGLQHIVEHGRHLLTTRGDDMPPMKYLLRLVSTITEELS